MNSYSIVDFNPFDGHEIQKICLTNESQREIWLSCIFGGSAASLSYNQSISLRLKGHLNVSVLEKSIADLIARHESLRSSFSADGDQVVIYKNFPVNLSILDISEFDIIKKEEVLNEYVSKEMRTPFDLENGPLLRLSLHHLDDETNVLTINAHHIIADGMSLGIIINDLGNIYSAYCLNQQKEMAPAFQLSECSAENIAFRKSKAFSENENFWLNCFRESVPETKLPTDFPRSIDRSFQGERIDLTLPSELPASLKSISIETGCSLVTLMLSSFEVFISKIIQQDQLVMGIFSSGRPEEHHANLVNHCVTLLPLKATINSQITFKDYLKKRKEDILDALDHQQYTFSELIKKLYIRRDASQVPLAPIVFNFSNGLGNDTIFEGLTLVECISNPREFENFEINLNILWEKDKTTLQCSYNKDLFKRATITQMLNDFISFLKQMIDKPEASIYNISVLVHQEILDHISERNNTYVPISKEETLLSYFDAIVAQYPQKTAISFHNEKFSFERLSQQANQLAHILLENGVREGDTIGIALRRSPKVIIAMLSILRCGGVYIPLDPEFPHDRIVYMLENSSAKVLITSEEFKGHFQSNSKELVIEDCWKTLSSYSTEAPDCMINGENLAYILYTSGSTGKPKGVQIRHYNLLNFLLSMQKEPGITADDKWLAITTISFDIAELEILLPLISGAEIVLVDEGMAREGAELLSIIKSQGITILQATPATWTMMLYENWEEKLPLKILCGGEALPKDLAHKLLNRSSEVWNMYGPTETTIWSTVKKLSLEDEIITVGRPIDNTLIYILDENHNMVPDGVAGEIYIAGLGLAQGYMNRPDLSIEKFIDNPFEPSKSPKMYGTGDLGIALENGEIQCLGRLDHQVKIRGFRIELEEIEHVLRKNDSVKEAIVIAREDNPDDKRLCAYIIPSVKMKNGIENALKAIWRQQLKEYLPAYMIPNDFVLMTKYPLTPNSKIDRKQLPKPGEVIYDDPMEKISISPKSPSNELSNQLKNEEIIVPTTESQKEIWLSCIIGGEEANLAYNLPSALKMVGHFDRIAFRKALEVVISRHEALRSNISDSGESLIIQPTVPLIFETIDISILNEKEQNSVLKIWVDQEINTPFNLAENPLFRVFLHKLNDKTHYFTLITHHIICDGGSIDIIFDEWSKLYNSYVTGEEITLEHAPQISNYALDYLTFNNTNEYHSTQNYWLNQYENNVPFMDMPVDFPRSTNRSYKGKQSVFSIKDESFEAIKKLNQHAKCSLLSTLLSAFEIFLYSKTKNKDVVVGLPVSGQVGSFLGLVGHCINLLPIKSTIDVNESFTSYLKSRTNQIYEDYDHQKLTYSELLKKLNLKRDPTRIPLVPIMFSMRSDINIVLHGIKHKFERHSQAAQTFEISLYVLQYKDKLEFTWAYNSDLFRKETIDKFHSDFSELLKKIIAYPDTQIKDLQIRDLDAISDLNKKNEGTPLIDSKTNQQSNIRSKTKIEQLIADIWSEHLNVQNISINSDFFEIGGHSLIAVKVMMDIEKKIGKRLPLASLFKYSTIEKLAKQLDLDQKTNWKSIVPIKVKGTRPPLYIIHGQGMHVLGFNTLANVVHPDQPIYGLQPKGLDPNEKPLESIEEIARGYVEELIEHYPNGPYAIMGYSSGGTIALEMSEQLLKMGKKMSFVGLIDTFYSGDSYRTLIKKNKIGEVFSHAAKFIGYGFVYFSRYPLAFIRHKKNFILGTLYNNYKKINPMKEDLSNPLYILNTIQKAHEKANNRYVLKRYKSDITLFRANDRIMTYLPNKESNGFAPYIDGHLKYIDIPLGHLQFFDPEYVDIFAEKIKEELNGVKPV